MSVTTATTATATATATNPEYCGCSVERPRVSVNTLETCIRLQECATSLYLECAKRDKSDDAIMIDKLRENLNLLRDMVVEYRKAVAYEISTAVESNSGPLARRSE